MVLLKCVIKSSSEFMKALVVFLLTLTLSSSVYSLETKKKLNGIVLKKIKSDSAYYKLGLRSQDKIIRINNVAIKNYDHFLEMMKNVKTLTLVRKKKEVRIKYK